MNINKGLFPTLGITEPEDEMKVLNGTKLVMVVSTMSNNFQSKKRPQIKECGLFLEWLPNKNREASFFKDRNSKGDSSSKGLIGLFLDSKITSGFLKAAY